MIEKLYKKYHKELTGWCQTMTGNLYTAEELVQEAFVRAMLHEEVFLQLEEKQCRSWLYRTIRNLYVDRVRHGSKETIVEEFPVNGADSEEMAWLEWETLLSQLPDMEGVIFTLRYLEGYNSKQIGEILSIPPGTVRFKLSLARKHLKEFLGGKGNVWQEKLFVKL